jgi:hypothetical protein
MTKKKRYKTQGITKKELEELKAHNKIINEKEKLLKIKHHKMWEEKKKDRRGFNEG